jgi:signal transduction histidine kinase
VGTEIRLAASWPDEADAGSPRVRLIGDDLPDFDGADHAFPVRHQGELLGALTLAMPVTDPMNPARAKLARDVAAQAGLVLRNVRLIEELRASRQRLVTAQNEERRRIERNIHDGAQQQLVALSVQLRLAESMVGKEPEKEQQLLHRLQAATAEALEDLRDLARGIYPPLLAEEGLVAAIESQARKSATPVEVESKDVGRYPQHVEAAVYFCALEALNNVAKYADASRAQVRLIARDGTLTFEVADDGVGFDPAEAGRGTGLQGMADRLAAIGGGFEVRTRAGSGTTVTGTVPVREGGAAR